VQSVRALLWIEDVKVIADILRLFVLSLESNLTYGNENSVTSLAMFGVDFLRIELSQHQFHVGIVLAEQNTDEALNHRRTLTFA
jgi:hypothetical protein